MDNLSGLAGDALVGAGLLGGARGALAARRGAGGAVPRDCFPEGTPILTSEGEKPIEEIRVGDCVLSADPGTGEQSYQKVTRTFQRVKESLLRIETADGRSIRTTEEHPFWVEGKGFVAAKRLARSDLLRDADGDRVRVERVTAESGRVTVYNFEVEGTHTYYAGGVWVHNTCPDTPIPPIIYREGTPSPSNLTKRPHEEYLSFRDSLSNPIPVPTDGRPVLRPGEPYIGLDTGKLPPGSVIPDHNPPEHISVLPLPVEVLKNAVAERGKFPK